MTEDVRARLEQIAGGIRHRIQQQPDASYIFVPRDWLDVLLLAALSHGDAPQENAHGLLGTAAKADRDRPPSTSVVQIAERIARQAHEGQKDTVTGEPYIAHVERVVAMVEGDEAKAVAWLHDVLEDSDFASGELLRAGIPNAVIVPVEVLTRPDNSTAMIPTTYEQYIERIRARGNPVEIAVKLADLRDHLRPNCPTRLRARYEAAWQALTGTPWDHVQGAGSSSEAMPNGQTQSLLGDAPLPGVTDRTEGVRAQRDPLRQPLRDLIDILRREADGVGAYLSSPAPATPEFVAKLCARLRDVLASLQPHGDQPRKENADSLLGSEAGESGERESPRRNIGEHRLCRCNYLMIPKTLLTQHVEIGCCCALMPSSSKTRGRNDPPGFRVDDDYRESCRGRAALDGGRLHR